MIKALKIFVASVLTLACLYVTLEFFVGFSGYGRYAPPRKDQFEFSQSGYRRYSPPERDHAGESETDTNETENIQGDPADSTTESVDSRDS